MNNERGGEYLFPIQSPRATDLYGRLLRDDLESPKTEDIRPEIPGQLTLYDLLNTSQLNLPLDSRSE